MQDRLLSEYYLPPISLVQSTDPAPDPDKLASQEESMATAGGRGVFPVLPPGTRRVPMAITVARYEGADGPRLHGWLETPGVPSDSLWGEWVVLDSTDSEVARIKRPLSASSCEPGELRAAEFATGLPPGHYLVGFSLRGTHGRRGTTRLTMDLPAPAARLDMSDVVVSCGTGDVSHDARRHAHGPVLGAPRTAGAARRAAHRVLRGLSPEARRSATLAHGIRVHGALGARRSPDLDPAADLAAAGVARHLRTAAGAAAG